MICKTPDEPLQDELCAEYHNIVTFILCKFVIPLWETLNGALQYNNYVISTFKVGQRGMTSTFRSQLIHFGGNLCWRFLLQLYAETSLTSSEAIYNVFLTKSRKKLIFGRNMYSVNAFYCTLYYARLRYLIMQLIPATKTSDYANIVFT